MDYTVAAQSVARDHEGPILIMDFLKELTRFILTRKKFWLVPVVVMLVVLGGLLLFSQGSAVAPFIYTLF